MRILRLHVKTGDKVRKGDLLLEADLNAIREAGYDVITPMIVCNTDCFAEVKAVTGCGGDAAGYGSDSHIEVISYSMVF